MNSNHPNPAPHGMSQQQRQQWQQRYGVVGLTQQQHLAANENSPVFAGVVPGGGAMSEQPWQQWHDEDEEDSSMMANLAAQLRDAARQ